MMGFAALYPSYESILSRSRDMICPSFASSFAPFRNRGRREDQVRAAPAVSRANAHEEHAHEHTGSAGASRPSLRSGFTAYFVLSPENGSFASVAPKELAPQELDASTATSGPHDFAVRFMPHTSVMASASTASHRAFVTCARPSHRVRRADSITDLPDGASGIFWCEGMDRFLLICPSG
jgi:hypothetical protein